MNDLLYDIFIKGVVPLAIVGVLGYAAKKFISLDGAIKWKVFSFLVVAAILAGGLYFQYSVIFSPYRTHYIPETRNIPGAVTKTDINRSYWEVTKNTLISLPILLKENREVSVYLEVDKFPISIEYYAERGAHKVLLEKTVSTLFEQKLTEELQGKSTYLTDSISKNDEKILVIKAKTDSDIKIYSYTVERFYTSTKRWSFLLLISFLWLLPSIFVIKLVGKIMHNKENSHG